ncbi:LytR family transcriptional regulator [Priestia endophytica]|uniref:polyisoprenyl-teichoic acid--peptidoglycan teichoic acid transferase TagU n=1 Tax=Priestia endophytica TaxID=135735 RepID=UPI000DCA7E60|nr:LytR family transcriptional regulator [Priestia endophytica]RAS81636.1 LytR family transcriptional regulator [Priestia endophytica]
MESRAKKKPKKKRTLLKTIIIIFILLILGGLGFAYYMYHSLANTLDGTHQALHRKVSEKRDEGVKFSEKDPISILLLGVDEREGDRGRSDSMILMTVNPETKSMKMVSIPRDTRAEIIGHGTTDKINHAYAYGGVNMAVDTVENFLDVPVDYYVQVNMESFKDIVDAVGGVTVNNSLDFTYDGVHFKKGQISLDGEEALKFSRMRYEDPRGDFGRQERQRQIIQAVIKKGASFNTLANYGDILDTIGKNIKTNLTFDNMKDIQSNYKEARHSLEQLQVNGEGQKVDGVYYYVVSESEREKLSTELKEHLNIKQ